MCTECLGNPTSHIFLSTSRDHEFLLSHKGNVSNVSKNSNECKNSNWVKNSINLIQITSPISSNPLHANYNAKKICPNRIFRYNKKALRSCIKDINFTDPVQMKRVHRDFNEQGKQ